MNFHWIYFRSDTVSISTVTLPDVISPPATPEPDSQAASKIGLVLKPSQTSQSSQSSIKNGPNFPILGKDFRYIGILDYGTWTAWFCSPICLPWVIHVSKTRSKFSLVQSRSQRHQSLPILICKFEKNLWNRTIHQLISPTIGPWTILIHL